MLDLQARSEAVVHRSRLQLLHRLSVSMDPGGSEKVTFLKRCLAYVRLALAALGSGPVVLRETRAAETQPEGFDVRNPVVKHRRSVAMDAPGALMQVRSVPLDEYEGPLALAKRRAEDPGAVP